MERLPMSEARDWHMAPAETGLAQSTCSGCLERAEDANVATRARNAVLVTRHPARRPN